MEHLTLNLIKHFVETYAVVGYLLIFLGLIFEGEIVVIFAGIFLHLGSINIFFAFLCILAGGAIRSLIGYSIGFYLQKHHSHTLFLRSIEKRVTSFFPKFSERPFISIFISRFFILGTGIFTLIFSGYKKIPIKIYARAEGLSLIIWSIGMLALGYFFSYTAFSISRDIRNFIGIIFVFFILFFFLEKIITFIFELFEIKSINKKIKN